MSDEFPDTPLNPRVHLLLDELSLAIRWNSACILLADYCSEITRRKVELSLRRLIRRAGHSVNDIKVTKTEYDIPLILRDYPSREETVFFVSGLQWAGGRGYSNAYRGLNMHREVLVEAKIRCVVWLTQTEFRKLPRHAPDFWAFRHKVVDFLDLPSRQEVVFTEFQDEDYPSAIERYKMMLRRDNENLSVHQKLAELYHAAGCCEDAILHYKKSIHLAPGNEKYLMALAHIYLELGQDDLSRRTQRRAGRLSVNHKN
jgi:tetratricopeptide (TPR) repeat protein